MSQNGQNGHVLGHDYEFALNFSSGSADLLVVVCISHKVDRRGSRPPGSSRRAGGYSPVLRLTADEKSPPLFPCPEKFTFWATALLPRGRFWGRVRARPARGRPKAVFLLLACCTQEEDAGPACRA